MWRRKLLFQSRSSRAHDATESLGLGGSGDRESGKKKAKKKRRIADLNSGSEVGKMGEATGEDDFSDRILELPDSVIHHIYGLMRCSKAVVRTAVLSKNWKRVFDSYQSFDFDQRWFRKRGELGFVDSKGRREEGDGFAEYVSETLPTRLNRLQCIDKFRVYAKDVDRKCVVEWVDAAIAKHVKELEVHVTRFSDVVLPFELNQSIYITFLKLSGAALDVSARIDMCNLRCISIKEARFLNMEVMDEIEENCPLLEDLRLVHCPNLRELNISILTNLQRVEVQECKGLKRIQIAAPELHTFWYHAHGKQKCKIDLKCSESLRNLTWKHRTMDASAFENIASMCPLLEKLELHGCNRIQKLRICSLSLKRLALIQCSKLDEIEVDTPNLNSFHYEGHVIPYPSIDAPRLSELKFSFKLSPKRSVVRNHIFFWNFEGCQRYKFVVYTKENMKIFEDASETDLFQASSHSRDAYLFPTSHCKLEMTSSSLQIVKNVENWLRGCRARTLELASSKGELLEKLNTLIVEREKNPSCCAYYSNKCWRHHIKGVITSFDSTKTLYCFVWQLGKMKWCEDVLKD